MCACFICDGDAFIMKITAHMTCKWHLWQKFKFFFFFFASSWMVGEKYVLWFAGLLLDMEIKLIHSSSFDVLCYCSSAEHT